MGWTLNQSVDDSANVIGLSRETLTPPAILPLLSAYVRVRRVKADGTIFKTDRAH